jgi:two-component system, cell cycle sensor histidine kinase and response regulator CckA
VDEPNIAPRVTTSVGQVPMERLRSVFDGMFDGVWLVAADGRTTYANEAMARLLGSAPARMRGKPMSDFLDDSQKAEVAAFLVRQPTHSGERMELRLLRADGTFMFGVVAGSPITTHGGAYVGSMLNVSDVTGKHSIDEQVMQNQRLEAIGQFAGGIAHDFNNLLTSIKGYTELARKGLLETDPVRSDLDQVLASAERAAAITRKLLAFTRRQILIPIAVDPRQVIADLVPILRPLTGDDVKIVLDFLPDSGWIRVDPTQFEQVIVNLVVNARDAMPTGGTVTISVRDLESPDPDRPDPDLSSGPFVRVSVADTGTGMDEATRARIFDPFFTTKSLGRGTGLGLSTVFGIVAQSGGQIHVETAPGQGSTFLVDLPCVDAATVPRSKPVASPTLTRSGVVLLVEDDDGVREFARRSLESAGFTVLAANGGDQALKASGRWAEGIDVLVADLVMPGMHGPELAAAVRLLRPGISLVFTSGYSDDAVGGGLDMGASGEFLPKPFSVEAIVQAVSRAAARARELEERDAPEAAGVDTDAVSLDRAAARLPTSADEPEA